jgi:hypothetical protein
METLPLLERCLGVQLPPCLRLSLLRPRSAPLRIYRIHAPFCNGGPRQELLSLSAKRRKGGALGREQPIEPLSFYVQRAPAGFAGGHCLPQLTSLAVSLA